jgi:hypothetical protein
MVNVLSARGFEKPAPDILYRAGFSYDHLLKKIKAVPVTFIVSVNSTCITHLTNLHNVQLQVFQQGI